MALSYDSPMKYDTQAYTYDGILLAEPIHVLTGKIRDGTILSGIIDDTVT